MQTGSVSSMDCLLSCLILGIYESSLLIKVIFLQFPKRSLVASAALLITIYGVFLVIHNFVFHIFHSHLFKIIKNHIPLHILFLSKQFNISVCINDTLWDLGIKVLYKILAYGKIKAVTFSLFLKI